MADIARLGFDIDTAALQKANTDLKNLTKSAGEAEAAAAKLSATTKSGFANIKAPMNAAQAAAASATSIANSAASAVAATAQASARAAGAASTAALQAANSNNVLSSTLVSLRGGYAALAAIIGGVVVSAISSAIDTSIQFKNSLYLAGQSGEDLNKTMNDLYNIANQTGQGINDIQLLYRRASVAGKDLGLTNQQVEDTVMGVASALKIQGTSARQAQGVLLQFTQAMGSGTVRAEEFNSIMEGALPIAQAAARGWAGGAISVGTLRNMMLKGAVTSKQFVEALSRGFGVTIQQAKDMGFTIEQSTTIAANGFVRLAGAVADVTKITEGATSVFADLGFALSDAAKWIENLKEVDIQEFISRFSAAFVVLATVITAVFLPSIIAIGTTVVTTMAAVTVAILANPIGLLVVAIVAVLVAMYFFRDEVKAVFKWVADVISNSMQVVMGILTEANNWIKDTFGIDIFQGLVDAAEWIKQTFGIDLVQIFKDFGKWLDDIFGSGDIVEITKNIANQILRAFSNMWEEIKFLWNNFPDVVSAAFDAAWQAAVDILNPFMQWAVKIINNVTNMIAYIWNNFGDLVSQGINNATEFVVESFHSLMDWAKKTINNFMLDVTDIWKRLPEILEKAMTSAANFVKTAFDGIFKWMMEKLNTIIEFANKVIDWMPGAIEKLKTVEIGGTGLVAPVLQGPAPDAARDARLAAERNIVEQKKIQNNSSDIIDALGSSYEKSTPKINKNTDAVTKNTAAAAKHKALDPYTKIITDAQQYIEKQELLTKQLGQSNEQSYIALHIQDLKAKADDANLNLTDKQIKKLEELGAAEGKAQAAHEAAKAVFDYKKKGEEAIQSANDEVAAATMSRAAGMAYLEAQKEINAETAKGIKLGPDQIQTIRDTAAAVAEATVKAKDYTEVMNTIKESGKEIFKSLFDALIHGKDIWQAFADAATKALDKIINKIEDVVIDNIFDVLSGKGSAGSTQGTSGGSGVTGSAGSTGGASGGFFNSIMGGVTSGIKSIFTNSSGGGGGFGGWLANLFGGNQRMGIDAEIANWSTYGSPGGPTGQASFFDPAFGTSMGSFGMSNAMGGVSAAMGGLALLTQKNQTTAQTIGHVGQMVGGILMMIPTPWTMAAGAIISIASSILPGLFGGGTPEPPTNQTYGQLSYGGQGFYTTGGAWGPDARAEQAQGPLGEMGKNMQAIFDALGGVADASKVWGVAMETFSKGAFSNATTFLVDPTTGNKTQFGQGSNAHDIGLEAAGATATIRTILGGALTDVVTQTLTTALTTVLGEGPTFQRIAEAITFAPLYDALNKPVLQTEAAFKELKKQFDAITKTAISFGLALDPINQAYKTQKEDVAKGFMHDINMLLDPVTQAFTDFEKARTQAMNEANYLIEQGMGSIVDSAKVAEYFLRKEAELKEQLYGVSIAQLEAAINQLLFGDLSNATATTAFTALQSQFQTDAAAAMAGDVTATAKIVSEGLDLAKAGQLMFGSGQQYEDLKAMIESVFAAIKTEIAGAGTDTTTPSDIPAGTLSPELAMAYQRIDQLTQVVSSQNTQVATLMKKLSDLTDLLQRTATNQ